MLAATSETAVTTPPRLVTLWMNASRVSRMSQVLHSRIRSRRQKMLTLSSAVGLSLAMLGGRVSSAEAPVTPARRSALEDQGTVRRGTTVSPGTSADRTPDARPAAYTIRATPELLHDAPPRSDAVKAPVRTSSGTHAVAYRHVRTIRVLATAYCPCTICCGPDARGVTASGRPVSYNGGAFIAADTNLLPFGTRLIVPGYHNAQPVEVIDRGGAIKGRHIDVYFPTHEQAAEWGRQWLSVDIVE